MEKNGAGFCYDQLNQEVLAAQQLDAPRRPPDGGAQGQSPAGGGGRELAVALGVPLGLGGAAALIAGGLFVHRQWRRAGPGGKRRQDSQGEGGGGGGAADGSRSDPSVFRGGLRESSAYFPAWSL
jgi:hypothetical protein